MIRLLTGDCRELLPTLPDASVQCVVTSPPYYGLRDYGTARWEGGDGECEHKPQMGKAFSSGTWRNGKDYGGSQKVLNRDCACGARRIDAQLGLEATPEEYLAAMVGVFRELRRVLRDDGTCWVNMGDSYVSSVSGYKPKDLLMMPARLALALQADGWWLRSDIIWSKPGPMPESARDRPTSAHEHVFLLSKKARYYFDPEAVKEASGANCRNVWTIASYPFSGWRETSRQVRVAMDAGVDGMKRKASPDCPVHADRPAPVANVGDDAHADGSLSHIARNGGHLVQAQADDYAPTGLPLGLMSEGRSSDLPLLGCWPSAIPHSNQSHRTDPALATSPACSASAETDDGTARTSEPQMSADSADRTLRSNSGLGDLGDSPSNRTASRIAHTPDEQALSSASDPPLCTCEWYIEKTEKTSHFATFPPELAARCIKAGTSERGCCAACGAPWVRVTDKTFVPQPDVSLERGIKGAVGQKPMYAKDWDGVPRGSVNVTTTGWAPSCSCNAETVPCTVLDPFSGAGTALLVADRLGRDAIGIDLSHAYVEMTRERLTADCPLFMAFEASPPPAEDPEDARMADLFAEAAE